MTAAIQVGQLWQHFQFDTAEFHSLDDLKTGRRDRALVATVVPDAVNQLAADIYDAAPQGMLIVAPPPVASDSPMVLSVVLRPLSWRDDAARGALSIAA